MSAPTNDERKRALRARAPRWYSGYLHLAVIHVLAPGGIAWCLWALRGSTVWEWLFVPAFFVFSNWFEWWIHRGPMHHSTRGLRILFVRHTLEHHLVYTERDMALKGHRDLALVLFPVWFLPAILLVNAPIPFALGYLVSPNLGYLFYASALAYYLVYEWFHLLHHLPSDWPLVRRPVAAWLRRHHAAHHDPARMAEGNFNVSFPLWDWLLGSMLGARGRGGVELKTLEHGKDA